MTWFKADSFRARSPKLRAFLFSRMDTAKNRLFLQDPLERRRWVSRLRGEAILQSPVDSEGPGEFIELEPERSGPAKECLTLLIRGRQCAWRCVHCDLWKHTQADGESGNDVAGQILGPLRKGAGSGRWVKIYNAGSFFDRAALPSSVVAQAASLLRGFEKVIVESHPAFVGDAIWRFRDAISPARLQIAMGLETAHPQALLALNKGFSVEEFGAAAEELRVNGVELRSFLLVRPPFLDRQTGLDWVKRSIDFSFNVGASVVSLILTRLGNGALDALEKSGLFVPPTLTDLEDSLAFGLNLNRGIVLADLWDLERLREIEPDFENKLTRLAQMNAEQRLVPKALDSLS